MKNKIILSVFAASLSWAACEKEQEPVVTTTRYWRGSTAEKNRAILRRADSITLLYLLHLWEKDSQRYPSAPAK